MYSYKSNNSKYADSGVNIETGNTIVKEIQKYIKDTENDKVISDLGGFNGMVELGDTILVSSMDGVGTKSIFVKNILGEYGLEYLGMDLVSHCINDILVSGAKPLFFLDYFASSKLSNSTGPTKLNFGHFAPPKSFFNFEILF